MGHDSDGQTAGLKASTKIDIQIDETFLSDYSVHVLHDLPSEDAVRLYEGKFAHDGIMLRIVPKHSARWNAIFGFGYGEYCAVFSTPNPETVCVISNGCLYLADVKRPGTFITVGSHISGAVAAAPQNLLVVYEDWRLYGIGPKGVAWQSNENLDGISNLRVQGEIIYFDGYLPPEGGEIQMMLDVRNGKRITGNISPSA